VQSEIWTPKDGSQVFDPCTAEKGRSVVDTIVSVTRCEEFWDFPEVRPAVKQADCQVLTHFGGRTNLWGLEKARKTQLEALPTFKNHITHGSVPSLNSPLKDLKRFCCEHSIPYHYLNGSPYTAL
jgi:hypothetical protein